jgi:hypothetical protein
MAFVFSQCSIFNSPINTFLHNNGKFIFEVAKLIKKDWLSILLQSW